ncbi:MAG: hypothetical protein K2O85_03735 [Helicobacter sp.]|nr:hypothetical protein [Helicobacter sp.]
MHFEILQPQMRLQNDNFGILCLSVAALALTQTAETLGSAGSARNDFRTRQQTQRVCNPQHVVILHNPVTKSVSKAKTQQKSATIPNIAQRYHKRRYDENRKT